MSVGGMGGRCKYQVRKKQARKVVRSCLQGNGRLTISQRILLHCGASQSLARSMAEYLQVGGPARPQCIEAYRRHPTLAESYTHYTAHKDGWSCVLQRASAASSHLEIGNLRGTKRQHKPPPFFVMHQCSRKDDFRCQSTVTETVASGFLRRGVAELECATPSPSVPPINHLPNGSPHK